MVTAKENLPAAEVASDDQIREKIEKPICVENPVGERVVDEPVFDFIENQMRKVGSLSHADVRWAEVESSVIFLLETKTKDLKLITHLLRCFLQTNTIDRFVLSMHVLADFMSNYWEECHPAQGKRGLLPRKKFLSQILQRFDASLDKLIKQDSFISRVKSDELTRAKDELTTSVKNRQLDEKAFTELMVKLDRWLKALEFDQASPPPVNVASVAPYTQSSSVSGKPVKPVSSHGESVKNTLLKVADSLAEYDFGHVLGIRVRRFAIWVSITTVPDADLKGVSNIAPVKLERINDYHEHLQREPDLALWRQVETSLISSPYWFDGQFLSAKIATELGHLAWAQAILEETSFFLERVPGLVDMSFKGGVPFIKKETRDWITSGHSTSAVTTIGDWSEKREEALLLAKTIGLTAALTMLEEGLAGAKEQREVFYWRLLTADVLRENGLDTMAAQHYGALYHSAFNLKVEDWEPSFINHLQHFVITK